MHWLVPRRVPGPPARGPQSRHGGAAAGPGPSPAQGASTNPFRSFSLRGRCRFPGHGAAGVRLGRFRAGPPAPIDACPRAKCSANGVSFCDGRECCPPAPAEVTRQLEVALLTEHRRTVFALEPGAQGTWQLPGPRSSNLGLAQELNYLLTLSQSKGVLLLS